MRATIGRVALQAVVCCGLLLNSGGSRLRAQAENSDQQASKETGEQGNQMVWKLLNTAIFAALLGYLIYKTAPKFFNARSADIQRAIREATGLKMDADLRYSEMDRKMATLAEEIKRMREQAAIEMEREHQRIQEDGARERERIQQNVAAELEALRAAGIRQARQRTAAAALDLAEKSLRDRAAGHQQEFLQDFVHLVEGAE